MQTKITYARQARTAVCGLGRIGWTRHLPMAHAHAGLDVVAVVDPLAERLAEARDEFGVTGHTDFAAMLQGAGPDLVIIASPTHLHADQAVMAMERGADVLCDKPIARDLTGTDRMIATMRRTGRKLMVYQPKRALAQTVALKNTIDSGIIGRPYMIKFTHTDYVRRADWQAWKEYGGGMLNNYGSHYIDLLLYLAGSSAARICAHLKTVATLGDADDVVKVLIETNDGITLDLDINTAAAVSMPPWTVYGPNGGITFDAGTDAFIVRYFDPSQLTTETADQALAAQDRKYGTGEEIPWQQQVVPVADYEDIDFYTKVYEYFALDQPPFVPIDETRELMRIIKECRRSACSQETATQ